MNNTKYFTIDKNVYEVSSILGYTTINVYHIGSDEMKNIVKFNNIININSIEDLEKILILI